MQERIKKLFKLENLLVFAFLVFAFVIRIFNITKNLAFHYDQGRDALVIWDLINFPHKFFLIGPTTGLTGVFRGPFYYYLITPFYLLGKGSPIWPEIFLIFISVLALAVLYYLAKTIGGIKAGVISLVLGTFSFELIYASRWLSNPTPMLLLSVLLVWMMFLIYDGKKWAWIVLAFILGSSFFHFGSSGELFYFPAVFIFAIWMVRRQGFARVNSTLNWKITILSVVTFLLTFSPLLIFNFKHGGILFNNVGGLLSTGKSFAMPSWQFASDRIALVTTYFSSLLFHGPYTREWLTTDALFLSCIFFLSKLIKNDKFKIVLILLASPFIGLIFFQGNYGNLYQYYLTGYYLIFLLVISVSLGKIFDSSWLGKIATLYFLIFFFQKNIEVIKPYLNVVGSESNAIVLNTQKSVIDWVYKDAENRDFNVDVYVPPVISYSYDYLFKWLGTTKYYKLPLGNRVQLLYTIYEDDPDHPERLKTWVDRQSGIGGIIKEQKFGAITVQQRRRIVN
jgi:4-amino-4-deoxy-L-arabinose transferase-like glycosyltransferase